MKKIVKIGLLMPFVGAAVALVDNMIQQAYYFHYQRYFRVADWQSLFFVSILSIMVGVALFYYQIKELGELNAKKLTIIFCSLFLMSFGLLWLLKSTDLVFGF